MSIAVCCWTQSNIYDCFLFGTVVDKAHKLPYVFIIVFMHRIFFRVYLRGESVKSNVCISGISLY